MKAPLSTGTHLAQGRTQVCVSPSEPHSTHVVQDQGGCRAGPFTCSILAQQDLVLGAPAADGFNLFLENPPEEGPSQGQGIM